MGPLEGHTIIEVAGLGPAPFAGMMLSDMGAAVVRVERASLVEEPGDRRPHRDVLNRGRRSVAVDLKHPDGAEVVLRLTEHADGLIEGFRPGVAERLGIGPDVALARNPRLVYGRMTGWGQDGPRAGEAGHDIDYIALAGILGEIGPPGASPVPPLNLVGDFGGGGMLLAFGMVCGLLERQRSGKGQVIDAAMVDGSALLATMHFAFKHAGLWNGPRGEDFLAGGAPFYTTYETRDGAYMAVGALEPQFFAALLSGLGVDPAVVGAQYDRSGWPEMRSTFATVFAGRTQREWAAIFAGTDACVAPVLDLDSAPDDEHNKVRGTFITVEGFLQPAPAPRFSRTPSPAPGPAHAPGSHTNEVLSDFGFGDAEIDGLRADGVIR